MEVLLEFGCDVDCVDADNRTALRCVLIFYCNIFIFIGLIGGKPFWVYLSLKNIESVRQIKKVKWDEEIRLRGHLYFSYFDY